nr:C-type lectin domain family 4 member M-like [Misgurnus anguillicaudatus]
MGEIIYDNVVSTESEGMNRQRTEMMVDIYECTDSVRDHDFRTETNTHQKLQCTESECVMNRRYRSATCTVCLVLLCVLLLTAVIVLCVLINTNNQQFNIKTKNLTEERDQLLTKYTNITEERDELIAKYNNITKLKEKLKEKNKLWTQLYGNLDATRKQKVKVKSVVKCDGWIYYQSSLYFISSDWKTWTESRRYCRERGADLIIINNKEEQDFINKNSGKDNLWIGLSDSDVEGRWKWVDGSTQSYSFWASGEPNGGRRENCVVSYSSGWVDYSCVIAFKWICEKSTQQVLSDVCLFSKL